MYFGRVDSYVWLFTANVHHSQLQLLVAHTWIGQQHHDGIISDIKIFTPPKIPSSLNSDTPWCQPLDEVHSNKHQKISKRSQWTSQLCPQFTILLSIFCTSSCCLLYCYTLKVMQLCISNGWHSINSHWVPSCIGANLITDNPFLYTILACHTLQWITDCNHTLFAFVKNYAGYFALWGCDS